MENFKTWLANEVTHHHFPYVVFPDRGDVDGVDMNFEKYLPRELLGQVFGFNARWSAKLPEECRLRGTGTDVNFLNFDGASTKLTAEPMFRRLDTILGRGDWLDHATTIRGNDVVAPRVGVRI